MATYELLKQHKFRFRRMGVSRGCCMGWAGRIAVLSLSAVFQCADCFIVPHIAGFSGVFPRDLPASRPGLRRCSQGSLVRGNRAVGARLRAPMQVVSMQSEKKEGEGETSVVLEPEW